MSDVQSAKCPKCNVELWALRKGQMTLRNKILKQDSETGGILAKCPGCGDDVPVPFLQATGETPKPKPDGRFMFRPPVVDNGG